MYLSNLKTFLYFVLIFFICVEHSHATSFPDFVFEMIQQEEGRNYPNKRIKTCMETLYENNTDAFFTKAPLLVVDKILNFLSTKDKTGCLILNKQIKNRIEGLVYKSIKAPLFQDSFKIENFANFIKQNSLYIREIDFSVFVYSFVKEARVKRKLCEEKLMGIWESLPKTLVKLKYTEKQDGTTPGSSYLNKKNFKNILENKHISHVELSLIGWSPFVNGCMDYEPKGSKIISFIPDNTLTYCSFHGDLLEEYRRATIFDLALLSQKLSETKTSFISLTYLLLDQEDILTTETPVAANNKLKELFIKKLVVKNKNPTFDFFKNFKYLEKLTIEKITIEDTITFSFYDLKSFHYKELKSDSKTNPQFFLYNESMLPINVSFEI